MTSAVRGSSNASPAGADDRLVDLHERRPLQRVLERLLERPAVAAADDEHAAGGRVRAEGGVGQHLVVHELVSLRRLHGAVQDEHPSEQWALVHLQGLVGSLLLVEAPRDPVCGGDIHAALVDDPGALHRSEARGRRRS
jgi:hypothetical protein